MEKKPQLNISDVIFNRYLILSVIGKGGMGTVYLAEDLRLKGKYWAIKEIIINQENYQQFIDEAKLLVGLEHPYLPKIIDYYPPNNSGYSYLVMDYINGNTLLDVFEREGRNLSYPRIIKYVLQLCELLDYLHNKQPTPIIYRDLKPTNVMIDAQDNLRLIDFGIARSYKKGKHFDTIQMGTVGFAAPEQFEQLQTDERTDIYSLGALMYYLLSGGEYYYLIQKPVDYIRNDLPPYLVTVVDKMLKANPKERYQNINYVKKDLLHINNGMEETQEIISGQYNSQLLNNANHNNINKSFNKKNYLNNLAKLVIVANLSKRAGSTFVTLNLAKILSGLGIHTGVIEIPFEPYIFDNVGLELRLDNLNEESLDYYSLPHAILEDKKIESEKITYEDGILWMVPDPRRPLIDRDNWTYNHMIKFLYNARKANILLYDVGSNLDHQSVKPLIMEADLVLIIIDPLPSEIMSNRERFDNLLNLREEKVPIEYVINYWTKGVNKKELMNVLAIEPVSFLPAIELASIHKAVYECRIPYSYAQVKSKLEKPLLNIVKRIVPKDFFTLNMSKRRGGNSLIHKLFER